MIIEAVYTAFVLIFIIYLVFSNASIIQVALGHGVWIISQLIRNNTTLGAIQWSLVEYVSNGVSNT